MGPVNVCRGGRRRKVPITLGAVTQDVIAEQTSRWNRAGPVLASAALALALYAVTLAGTYVYDDVFIVREDPRLHDPSRWAEYWVTDYFAGGIDKLYRPLVSMSFAL